MSTYLQLCQDFQRECGISGTQISAVTSQTGEYNRIVNWVRHTYTEIQNKHPNWRWLRRRFYLETVADDGSYAYSDAFDLTTSLAISRFRRWWPLDELGCNNFTIYLQSAGVAGERYLPFIDWTYFKDLYLRGTQTSNQPAHVSIDPQNNIVVGPAPNDVFVVRGEYQRSAQILAADSDEPEMPANFHQLIVYDAMKKKYAPYESAPEVFDAGQINGRDLWRQLELDQLPAIPVGSPFA